MISEKSPEKEYKTIFIASDHAGLEMKNHLIGRMPFLPWKDLGPFSSDSVDYPDFAAKLGEGRVLLVLDNLEQLGDGASRLVDVFLARTRASLLVTSRRRTHARAEHAIALGPLDVPPLVPTAPEILARFASIRLFFERATNA